MWYHLSWPSINITLSLCTQLMWCKQNTQLMWCKRNTQLMWCKRNTQLMWCKQNTQLMWCKQNTRLMWCKQNTQLMWCKQNPRQKLFLHILFHHIRPIKTNMDNIKEHPPCNGGSHNLELRMTDGCYFRLSFTRY